MIEITRTRHRVYRLALFGLLVGLLGLAWSNRFIQDDAFISFHYADNLVNGHGLVWAPGERIEGYTNFLWTLLMAIPLALRQDPVLFSQLLGLACFVGTLLCTYRLASRLLESQGLALIVLALLGTNYTFSAYATGGLETQLQAFLVTAILLLTDEIRRRSDWKPRPLLLLSLCYSLALMTRLDSAIFVLISGVYLLWRLWRGSGSWPEKGRAVFFLGAPSLLLVGSWLIWKLVYYGNILPNTFYAKADAGLASQIQGLKYVQLFLTSYWFVVLLLLPIFYRRRLQESLDRPYRLLMIAFSLWVFYLIKVGGDFMEFRFFVPVLPILFLLLTWFLFKVVDRNSVAWTALLLVLAGSYTHSQLFGYEAQHGVEGIQDLAAHLDHPDQDWDGIGRQFRAYFGENSSVKLATTAAGAIPFYSRLQTLDMLGLNDAWIPRHGLSLGNRPGHQRAATFDYLTDQQVHLVIGHPWLRRRGQSLRHSFHVSDLQLFRIFDPPAEGLPNHLRVIEFPVQRTRLLRVLYLTPHPAVDEVIRQHGLRTFEVFSSEFDSPIAD